ncbi:hypothetical protein M2401_000804 [Pseudomonas sp. JUb42]|nr:hypothetical protein [Pseudomonas sp. JUb42]
MPDEPETDSLTQYLLNTFRNVCRGRRLLSNMSGTFPIPLAAREISDWLEAHPTPLPRHWVDEVMFALDGIVMSEASDE